MPERMDERRINQLAKKWRDGTLTNPERQEIERWYASFDDSELEILSDEDQQTLGRRMYQYISGRKDKDLQRRRRKVLRGIAAAAIAVLGLGLITFLRKDSGSTAKVAAEAASERFKNDVLPGHDHASLKLSDGRTVILDGSRQGLLAEEAGTRIISEKGRLFYQLSGSGESGKSNKTPVYNTIQTPRGGQYQMVLPDGSMAWLNAASSIRFPTSFADTAREVEITGEVYFDIKHDSTRPFSVKAFNRITVQVLGTRFNIAAYENEAGIKTTLIDGSVKLMTAKQNTVLKPGQQGSLGWPGGPIRVNDIDVNAATAWKSGYFNFENASIEEIMRQLSRWYDVEVVYEETVRGKFNVLMWPRNQPISRLLKLLELTGHVKFGIEGRRVTVAP